MRLRRLRRKARIGKPLTLSLLSPGTSGYVWLLSPGADAGWRVVRRVAKPGNGFGTPVRDVFSIELTRSGHETIAAELKRPWETEPIERVVVDVEVDARRAANPVSGSRR